MKIEGGCHCGQFGYRAEVDPDAVIICHCTDCQTLSGSAYRSVAPALEGSFQILHGELRVYVKTAENGSRRAQGFCPECGTPIYSAPDDEASGFFGLRVGAIKQRALLVPKVQYWCRSAQPWVQDLSAMPRIETQ
jgi:hypothetical protein